MKKRKPHPFSVLSEREVAWIKITRRCGLGMRPLARSFGVSKQCIKRIDEGDSYAYVTV